VGRLCRSIFSPWYKERCSWCNDGGLAAILFPNFKQKTLSKTCFILIDAESPNLVL